MFDVPFEHTGARHYLNHLPVISEAIGGPTANNSTPSAAFEKSGGVLFQFEADPPTVTMQVRLREVRRLPAHHGEEKCSSSRPFLRRLCQAIECLLAATIPRAWSCQHSQKRCRQARPCYREKGLKHTPHTPAPVVYLPASAPPPPAG